MTDQRAGRRIVRTSSAEFGPYDLEGPLQPEFSLLTLTYDKERKTGTYMMRLAPGSTTIHHTHGFQEEFMILEGELIDDDGTVLRPGDHIIYDAGTYHNSRTETGCVLIGFDWKGQ